MASPRIIWRRVTRRLRATAEIIPAVDERHTQEARAGMLRETLEVSNYSSVTHFVVTLVLGYVFWGHAPDMYLIILNTIMFLIVSVTIGSTFLCRHRIRATLSEAAVNRGFLLTKVMAFLVGLLWSSMPIILIPTHEAGYRLIAVATVAGLISDAYVVGPIFAVSSLFVVPVMIGGYIGLYLCKDPFGLPLSMLLSVYAVFVLISTRRLGKLSHQRLVDHAMVESQSQTIGLLLHDFEESATDWLWEIDVEGRLLHAPAQMAAAVALDCGRLQGLTIANLLSEHACCRDDHNGVKEVLAAMARRAPFHDHVVRLTTAQGTRWLRLRGKPIYEESSLFAGYRGVGADITHSHEAEARITYLASYDVLTGLLNRASFQSAIERACRKEDISANPTVLLSLDLDGFKAINDCHGHATGDLLLRSVADRLAALCDGRGRVYRLGGDEFAILPYCDAPAEADTLAAAAIEHIGKPHLVAGMSLSVGLSIGIVHTSEHVRDTAVLLSQADLALYSAKASGKGQSQTFNPKLEIQALRRHRLNAGMRAALAADELQLHYQPLVDVETEAVVGVEALLRWHSPEQGWISPAEIIPIAETTGFIVDIGRWALRKACTDALEWPGLTIAVNISSNHFRSDTFCDEVDAVLAQTGLAPSRLEIEITESIFLEGEGKVVANMQRLRASGVRLSLDDFGTGYSSLSYLSKFKFDKLKIDRSFIRDLQIRDEVLTIFDAINAMAFALRMRVTVEGVEQKEQIDIIRKRFVGTIQGYYYYKPMLAEDVSSLVRCPPATRPQTSQVRAL